MITFSVTADSFVSPEQISEGILDTDKWLLFAGYGPLPGVKKVTKKSLGDSIVGTEFYVENTDGSKHRESILAYDPSKCVVMRMDSFGPPLKRLATHFIERWDFADMHPMYRITRTFELHPKSALAAVPLWLIARLLKKAVARHTRQIASQEAPER